MHARMRAHKSPCAVVKAVVSRVDSAACLNYQEGRQGRHPRQFEEEDVRVVVERGDIGVSVGKSRLVDRVARRESDPRDFFVGVVDNFDDLAVNKGGKHETARGVGPLRKDHASTAGLWGGGGGHPPFGFSGPRS